MAIKATLSHLAAVALFLANTADAQQVVQVGTRTVELPASSVDSGARAVVAITIPNTPPDYGARINDLGNAVAASTQPWPIRFVNQQRSVCGTWSGNLGAPSQCGTAVINGDGSVSLYTPYGGVWLGFTSSTLPFNWTSPAALGVGLPRIGSLRIEPTSFSQSGTPQDWQVVQSQVGDPNWTPN